MARFANDRGRDSWETINFPRATPKFNLACSSIQELQKIVWFRMMLLDSIQPPAAEWEILDPSRHFGVEFTGGDGARKPRLGTGQY